MALPIKPDLEKMDYSYKGSPFVDVPTKLGLDVLSMTYSFGGYPYVPNTDIGVAPVLFINVHDQVNVAATTVRPTLFVTVFDSVVLTEKINPLNFHNSINITEYINVVVFRFVPNNSSATPVGLGSVSRYDGIIS